MSTKTEQQTDRTALYEVLDDFDTAMLTTFTADGTPHGRPMHVAQRDGDTLWFVTGIDSGKVREIASGDPAVLTFQSSDTWVAATGEVEISHDRGKVDELWSPVMKAWFPEGPEDPGVVAVRVDLVSAEYWATTGTDKVSFAFGVAKSILTGTPIDSDDEGEHGEVRL